MKNNHQAILLGLIFVAIVAADVVTKFIVTENSGRWASFFILIEPYRNVSAFNLPLGSSITIFLSLVAILLAFAIFMRLRSFKKRIGLVMVMAGGISNFMERLWWQGYVTDIVRIGTAHFNLADVAIFAGLGVLLLTFFLGQSKKLYRKTV